MADEEKPEDSQEPVITPMPEITNLSAISIQIHELFLELRKSGFKRSEALTLAGMVLTNTATVERTDEFEFYDDDDEDIGDDEQFGNWNTILDENPEGDEKI
jgi:hypothetical protein